MKFCDFTYFFQFKNKVKNMNEKSFIKKLFKIKKYNFFKIQIK
jgi:hypothetical protein